MLHRPATSGPHAAILKLHGGGFIAGTAEREDAAMRALALALDAAIYAAPGRATILAGFPPTFIATGAIDLFVDEDPRFAQSLIGAGVPTELHDYPGACHGFTLIAAAGVTQQFERDSLAALHRALDMAPTKS